jgi:hypothetical protein
MLDLTTLDALWKARHNPQDARDLERLLDALSRETQDLEERYELDWRRARLHQFHAMQKLESGDEKAARADFERGEEVSQWTLANAQRGEGRFWHAVNALEFARMGGKWGAFWALKSARDELQSVWRGTRVFTLLERIAFWAASRISRREARAAMQMFLNFTWSAGWNSPTIRQRGLFRGITERFR